MVHTHTKLGNTSNIHRDVYSIAVRKGVTIAIVSWFISHYVHRQFNSNMAVPTATVDLIVCFSDSKLARHKLCWLSCVFTQWIVWCRGRVWALDLTVWIGLAFGPWQSRLGTGRGLSALIGSGVGSPQSLPNTTMHTHHYQQRCNLPMSQLCCIELSSSITHATLVLDVKQPCDVLVHDFLCLRLSTLHCGTHGAFDCIACVVVVSVWH